MKINTVKGLHDTFFIVESPKDTGLNSWQTLSVRVFSSKSPPIYSSSVDEKAIASAIAAGYESKEWRQLVNHLVASYERNYPNNLYFLIDYKDQDYLIISENYHGGYGCINLATGEKISYNPGSNNKFGPRAERWCWANITSWDNATNKLRVEGCMWGMSYDITEFDLTNIHTFPWPEEYIGDVVEED